MTPDVARGILLAAVMKVDHLVRPEEIDTGRIVMSREKFRQDTCSRCDWTAAIECSSEIDAAIAVLVDEDEKNCEQIVLDLWEMSICDAELHANENALIHNFASRLGVAALPNGMRQMPVLAGLKPPTQIKDDYS